LEGAAPKPVDPFELLNEFGCSRERVAAEMKILTESIAELSEDGRNLRASQQVSLNRDWLLLDIIRRDQERNVAPFQAEKMLYAARLPRNWGAQA
jgi:hypothetical protein